jgi:hypothetical protein
MGLQRKKYAPAYNRAQEKTKVRGIDSEYGDLSDDSCHETHEWRCEYCNPSLGYIRMGILGHILHKLGIRKAKHLEQYTC